MSARFFGSLLVLIALYSSAGATSFSGLSKGLYEVKEVIATGTTCKIGIVFPKDFKEKLENTGDSFGGIFLTIDGIKTTLASITESSQTLFIQVELPCSTYSQTTLNSLKNGDRVSIGLQSTDPAEYLLQDGPIHRVVLTDTRIADGHQHTLELAFEAPLDQANLLMHSRWIGLNGSSLTVRDLKELGNKLAFKIHVGQQTRALTIFGNAQNGHEFNLTPQVP